MISFETTLQTIIDHGNDVHRAMSEAFQEPTLSELAQERLSRPVTLLTIGNPKVAKGAALGWHTAIMHLSPADLLGKGNTCPMASLGCKAACLNTAGRGGITKKGQTWNPIQIARGARTLWFWDNLETFKAQLVKEIHKHVRASGRAGLKPAVRLNGTSDIVWERKFPELFDMFPEVQFYDYTAIPGRVTPRNYDLTFSRKEDNGAFVRAELARGARVAGPLQGFDGRGGQMLSAWTGSELDRCVPVEDGDAHDLTFLQPGGSFLGLKPKGKARRDSSGFVLALGGSL